MKQFHRLRNSMTLVMIALLVAACGSNPWSKNDGSGLTPAMGTTTPVKDQTISTDFTDQGIRIEYTLTGEIKRIIVIGYAEAWKGNVDVHSEMDAMDKLVKYIYGRDVSSERKVTIYAKTLDDARDNTMNRFKNVDGTINYQAREVENQAARDPTTSETERNNTSRRVAERLERQITETMQTITSRGRLTAVRKVSDRVIQNGRIYVAQYEWSPQDQATANKLRHMMSQ